MQDKPMIEWGDLLTLAVMAFGWWLGTLLWT